MNALVLTWFKRHSLVKHHALALYFILAYAISWAFMIPVALTAQGLVAWRAPYALYYLASFGPMASALIVSAIVEGRAGFRKLLGQLLRWRVPFRYYAFAILAPFGLFSLAVILNRALTGVWLDFRLLGQIDYLPYLGIPGVLGLWFLPYGLGEEFGWRGFALPRLPMRR